MSRDGMSEVVKKIIKAAIPKPMRRQIHLLRSARRLRKFYFGEQLSAIRPLVFLTGETHNFTYDLTEENLRYLAEIIAVATDKSPSEIGGFVQEAINDRELRNYFNTKMASYKGEKTAHNVVSPFGRRLGWYAVARATKPRLIVETGVERGHGALLLCAALLRNCAEGAHGTYLGTDIDPTAGYLLSGEYHTVGKILYGDSIKSLMQVREPIDLFINDSDHSAEYEAEEYRTIASKLSPRAILLGDNAHVTDKLARFSRETSRSFLMFNERPKNHWYPGAGIGISFVRRQSALEPR
jgi:Methyltransferase domain